MITEKCFCGASITVEFGGRTSHEQTTVAEWRREHQHKPSVISTPTFETPPDMQAVITVQTDPEVFHGALIHRTGCPVVEQPGLASAWMFCKCGQERPEQLDVRPAKYDKPEGWDK